MNTGRATADAQRSLHLNLKRKEAHRSPSYVKKQQRNCDRSVENRNGSTEQTSATEADLFMKALGSFGQLGQHPMRAGSSPAWRPASASGSSSRCRCPARRPARPQAPAGAPLRAGALPAAPARRGAGLHAAGQPLRRPTRSGGNGVTWRR